MEEEVLFSIMAVLVVLAAFLSIALTKLKFPALVGFLIAGILIHNYVKFDYVSEMEEVVSIFSDIGLIMLMFSIGMEIDIYKLKVQGRFAVMIALVQIPVMMITGIIAGNLMGFTSVQAITLGAILSGASTAVVLAVLKSNNVLSQDKMDILIIVMIIEDITQVVLLSILTPMIDGETMSTDALIKLILYIVIFMVSCFTIGLKLMPKIINWFYDRSNDELISLLCVGILFVFSLLANLIGLSVAIGAFLTGVMVGMSRPKHVVEHFVDPMKSLFMAMFFISVGMEVEVNSLVQNIPMIIGIYAIFAVFMFVAVNIGYWVANGDSRTGWISAFSMCTMGEFAFIIVSLAHNKIFDDSIYSAVIGAAILSMVILPFLVRYSNQTYDAVCKMCPNFLKRIGGAITRQRDTFYHGLSVASYRTKEGFNKALTNAAFIILLIFITEIVFYSIYDPLSSWLTKNMGLDVDTWKLIILAANIGALLDPCRRLAKFIRLSLYLLQKGKEYRNGTEKEHKARKVFDYFSTFYMGAAMALIIVIIVPNGIDNFMHIVVMLFVLVLTLVVQLHKYRKEMSPDTPAEPQEPSA